MTVILTERTTIRRLQLALTATISLVAGAVLWGAGQPSVPVERLPLPIAAAPKEGFVFVTTDDGAAYVVTADGGAKQVVIPAVASGIHYLNMFAPDPGAAKLREAKESAAASQRLREAALKKYLDKP